jgi:phage I-like protein
VIPNVVNPTMFDPLVPYADGAIQVPVEFRIFSAGVNATEKGDWLFDEKAAATVMDGYARRGVDLTMDYEHMALADPPMVAPAACKRWVPQIRNGELWATECKWTDKAYGHLASGEYRYFSPAFTFDEETGRIREVLNVALTNIPAMRGIAPLVAASQRPPNGGKETGMDYEKLFKDLQVLHEQLTAKLTALEAEKADLTAKLSAATGGSTEAAAETTALTATLSLPATARMSERAAAVQSLVALRTNIRNFTGAGDDATAIGIVHAWKQDAAKVVTLSAKVAELESAQLAAEFDAVLEAGLAAKKIDGPAGRDALKQAALTAGGGRITREGIAIVKASIGAVTAGAAGGGKVPEPKVGAPTDGLDPIQVHIATVCGRPATPAQQSQQK